jgi:hypothetical protein
MNWPKISVWSQFRNAAGRQIELYQQQINALDYPPELLKLYLCEGDSDDDTLAQLRSWAVDDSRIRIIKHDTGIPHFAHSPRKERMKAVSENGNKGWGAIREDAWGDFALMLESDLLYRGDLLRLLITRRPAQASIFSPMVWIPVDGDLRFYDIWAYRLNGEMFEPNSPGWYYARHGSGLFEVDSVGSVVLFQMNLIAEGLRLGETDCVLGMCNEARKRGYRIFCDPTIDILHPEIQGVS